MTERRPLAERFWPKVDVRGPDECWPWLAGKMLHGLPYGRINLGGKRGRTVCAHRVSWTLAYSEPPDGAMVCHRCDNPVCVNPAHLFLGTAQTNMADKMAKGRHRVASGPTCKQSMTRQQAYDIRRLRANGLLQDDIARMVGVSQRSVSRVVRGEHWSVADHGVGNIRGMD